MLAHLWFSGPRFSPGVPDCWRQLVNDRRLSGLLKRPVNVSCFPVIASVPQLPISCCALMLLGSWRNRVWGELSCSYGVHILWGFFSTAFVRGDFNPHFVSLLLPPVIFLPVISWGVTANCSCLTLLEASTESSGLGNKRFLPPLFFSSVGSFTAYKYC